MRLSYQPYLQVDEAQLCASHSIYRCPSHSCVPLVSTNHGYASRQPQAAATEAGVISLKEEVSWGSLSGCLAWSQGMKVNHARMKRQISLSQAQQLFAQVCASGRCSVGEGGLSRPNENGGSYAREPKRMLRGLMW